MYGISNCPICGKYPLAHAAQEGILCKIECCDHSIANPIDLVKKWNQYSAAMELAKARSAYAQMPNSIGDEETQELWDDVTSTTKRVLEVFGEKE